MKTSEVLHFMTSRFTGDVEQKQTQGSILPSSRFLVRKMVKDEEISTANVIVEFGPGTGVFTEEILKKMKKGAQLFLVEVNEEHCDFLKKKFPELEGHIYNIDVRDFHTVLHQQGVNTIDIVISGLPFRSIPHDVLEYVFGTFLPMFSTSGTIFKQFSYIPSTRRYRDYISFVLKDVCVLNFPPAFVFTMGGFRNEITEVLKAS